MFHRLGAWLARHPVVVIVLWVAAAIALHRVAPRWDQVTHDGDLAYLPAAMLSVQGAELQQRAFPDHKSKSQLAVLVERPDGKLLPADLELADRLAERMEELAPELKAAEVWSRGTEVLGDKLTSPVSENGQATVIALQITNELMSTDNMRILRRVLDEVAAVRADPNTPVGLNFGVTGSTAIGGDMLSSAAESIKNTELTTIILVVLILLVVYRAPALVVIPLLTIGMSLLVALDMLALLTQVGKLDGFDWWHFKVFTTTKIFIVVILFGAGTDFCLFLIARYREELERGRDRAAAVAEAVGQVGEALLGSALTTICGLGMMYFADFGKFRNSGPAIALCLTVTLCACLTLAPALLRACGPAVFWPVGINPRASGDNAGDPTAGMSRFWLWASGIIVARPGVILVGSVVVLLPLAYAGWSVPVTYDFLNELEPNRPSVEGSVLARRHFAAGETAPISVLAVQRGAQFDKPVGQRQIGTLTRQLYDVEGVDRVRSITEPTGDRPGRFQPLTASGRKKIIARQHKRTEAAYISQTDELRGDVTRLDLVLSDEPFSLAAVDTVAAADAYLAELARDESSPWHGAQFWMVGTTAAVRDLQAVTASDQRLIQQLVVLAVLGVLIVILRRPLVCVYLIVSVLFSYYVTIGATKLAFGWWYGATFHGLDWKVPIFLFVILIAIGEDYNIYLVTRVLEEQRRYGPLAGLRLAVARTGGIITSCGVIMAGTFISMMTGTLRGMLELGFALSLGVMLDTCMVRPVLVPAFLTLVEWTARGVSAEHGTRSAELNANEASAAEYRPVV